MSRRGGRREGVGGLLALVDDAVGGVALAVLALQREGVPVGDQILPELRWSRILAWHEIELVVVVVRVSEAAAPAAAP